MRFYQTSLINKLYPTTSSTHVWSKKLRIWRRGCSKNTIVFRLFSFNTKKIPHHSAIAFNCLLSPRMNPRCCAVPRLSNQSKSDFSSFRKFLFSPSPYFSTSLLYREIRYCIRPHKELYSTSLVIESINDQQVCQE